METSAITDLKITSEAFKQGEPIPEKYTCDGDNVSPPFKIDNLPSGAISLAVIADDPDALNGTFTHWVAWNISPEVTIREGFAPALQGKNGKAQAAYTGPCPPSGSHRYFFKFYALDAMLELENGASRDRLERLMQGHILSSGELMGTYAKKGS